MKENTLEIELRNAIQARDAIVKESEALEAQSQRLDSFELARNEAQAEVDAIIRTEAEALGAWALNGAQGNPPQPDTKARDAAARKLAAAEHSMRAVGIARQDIQAKHLQLSARYGAADAVVRAARARVLGERYKALTIEIRTASDNLDRLQVMAQQLFWTINECDARYSDVLNAEIYADRATWMGNRDTAIADAAQRAVAEITQAIAA